MGKQIAVHGFCKWLLLRLCVENILLGSIIHPMREATFNHKIMLTLCCGLLISLSVFLLLKNWEESNRRNEFNYKALDHAAAIQTEFEHIAKNVAQVRFLIEHNIDIEHDDPNHPDDFMPMAEKIIIDDPNLLSIAWAMLQTDADQRRLNIVYVQHGNHNHNEISDIQLNEYYDEHIDDTFILDQRRLVSAFIHKDSAVSSNELNFIAPVSNEVQRNDQFVGKHIGSLIVELEVSGIIERAISKLPVAAQDIALNVFHRDGSKETVYRHASRSRSLDDSDTHTGLYTAIPFEFSGLRWQLEFEAAPQFLRTHPIILAWQSLLLCLLLTFFFVWYARINHQQIMRIDQQVIVRTQELEHSKDKLRRIINNLQDVYFQTDTKGVIKVCSPSVAQLIGYKKGEVIGTPITNYYTDSPLHKALLSDLQQSKNGKLLDYESQALHRDGHHVWTSCNVQFTYNQQGNIDGLEGTIRDITEKKQADMQRKIEHSQRLESLGVLAGGIAHDFNNILASIMGNASLAGHKVFDRPRDSQKHLDKIIIASEKAAALCQQMLAYAGKGRFIIETINLSVLLDEITQLLTASISPNVRIIYALQDHLPHIDGDKAQLQQLLMNFTTNANESIHDTGEITISTSIRQVNADDSARYIGVEHASPGDYISITFSDTGCGMDNDTINKVFDPFFTTKFIGRGLGMSAVLGIIKSHGGFIQCESSLGKGTTFTVLLPVSQMQPESLPAASKQPHLPHSSGIVLVIDDDEDLREIGQAMLEDLGWKSLAAEDGQAGVDIFRRQHEHVVAIILDMTMPGMDGLSTFDALKSIDSNANIILSTGYSRQQASDRFAGKALAGFLQKPYTIEQLQQQLSQITA